MSDFSGLRTALSALYAQRRGLELTGHNVANARTEGYSRQRMNLSNVQPAESASMWSKTLGAGQGVRVVDIVRFRDQYLELRASIENGVKSSFTEHTDAYRRLEDLFAEPSDIGIAQNLSDLWAGFDDVANYPSDTASRAQLLERARTLTSSLNQAAGVLDGIRRNSIEKLNGTIADVNTLARNVADLNAQIKSATLAGLNVNDLADERDRQAGKLASMIGATVQYRDYGQADVVVGGTGLVLGSTPNELSVDSSGATVVVKWTKDNYPASSAGGTVGGLLDVINTTVPAYTARIDTVANTLQADVNALHARISGSIGAANRDQSAAGSLSFQLGLNGGAFTTVSLAGADWSGATGAATLQTSLQSAIDSAIGSGGATVTVTTGATGALSISVTPVGSNALTVRADGTNAGFTTLLGQTAVGRDGIGGRAFFSGTDAKTIAVSTLMTGSDSVAAGVAGGGPLDNQIALQLAELHDATSGADANYRALITTLGVEAQTAQQRLEIQSSTVEQVENNRAAYSGVSIDEEMTNMVQFQHAYDAAARFMTSIDQMLDTLINGTGVVGR